MPFSVETDIPRKLYRYTKKRFAEDLINNGRLRMGTLFGYRGGEALTEAQADEFEGTHTFTGHSQGVIACAMVISLDNWILCLSAALNPAFLQDGSFGDADCIVEIDTFGFCAELAAAMAHRCSSGMAVRIRYLDADDYDTGLDFDIPSNVPAGSSIKPNLERYAGQEEWRLAFDPRPEYLPGLRDFAFPYDTPGIDELATPGAMKITNNSPFYPKNILKPIFIISEKLRDHCKIVHEYHAGTN